MLRGPVPQGLAGRSSCSLPGSVCSRDGKARSASRTQSRSNLVESRSPLLILLVASHRTTDRAKRVDGPRATAIHRPANKHDPGHAGVLEKKSSKAVVVRYK